MNHRILALSFPLGLGSYSERCSLEVDREVSLWALTGVAVAVSSGTIRLGFAGPVREPMVVLMHLQRIDVDSNLAVVRCPVADARVDPVSRGWRTESRIRRSTVDVDSVVLD